MGKFFKTVTVFFFALTLLVIHASGQSIKGTVFFDGNNNGTYESANEVGFGGVTVTAYDAANTVKATTTTALTGTLGSYTLSGLTTGTTYRVEFTLPSGYNDGAQPVSTVSAGSRSSIQFVAASANGTTANFGIYTTGVCDPDKTVRVVAGCADTGGGSTSVASWNYFTQRKTSIADGATNPHDDDMTFSQVGVPMGMGSRAKDKLVFFSTVSSPLTTIFPAAPGGSSAIYVADYSGTGNAYVSNKLLTKLSSLSPAINVTSQFNVGSVDNTGEYGLGGLDLTDDGKTLYVVNMGNGKIVKLDISGVTYAGIPSGGYTGTTLPVSEITIPTAMATCTGGRFRPSALEIYAGSLYVGGVCDASTSTTASNLRLKVLKMDLTAGTWTELLNFDLSTIQGGTLRYAGWPNKKWSDTFVGNDDTDGEIQPYVNDLAIDDYGSVIIGVTNRKVFSAKSDRDMGYVLRTFRKADGTMAMENDGKAGPLTSAARSGGSPGPGLNNGSASNLNMIPFGPGGDWFLEIGRTSSHPYLHTGGVYILPGTKELVSGFSDPLDGNTNAGARYIGYDDGVTGYGISLANVKVFALTGTDAVCEASNIEIGNLVWKDNNNNGRQDPGEPGIKGVTVKLKNSAGTTTIATATTDDNGNYIFSNATGTSTANFIYGLTALTPLTSYTISIDNVTGQTPLATLSVTTADITANGEDQRDSDGTMSGANALVAITTEEAGANNHTFDFGFALTCTKPNAGADRSICAPAITTTLTGFSPAGGTWAPQAGNPAAATVSNAGAVAGMTVSGVYKFIYTVTAGTQTCTDTVQVTRNAKPNAGTDKSLACADLVAGTLQTTTTLTGFSPAGGTWAVAAGNPAAATVTNAGVVANMTVAGTYKFVYTLNGCKDTVAVGVQACSGCTKPDAGDDLTLACADPVAGTIQTTATLTGFSPAGGTWSPQAGNPAAATVNNAGTIAGMTAVGTYNFIYSVTAGGQTCSDTVAVTVEACAGCTKPDAGNDLSLTCADPVAGTLQTTATLTGFSPADGTWTAQTGNPAAATVDNAGAIAGMTAVGTYKFIYTVIAGGQTCTDTVAVTVEACAGCTKPNAGADKSLACADPVAGTLQTGTTLTGFSPVDGTWSAQTGNPAAATVDNDGVVAGMTAVGTYKFIYTVIAGGQTCTDTVAVTVEACAGCTKPNAGADKSLACADPVAGTLQTGTTLTGFSPAGGIWAAQAGNPAAATVDNAGAVAGMTVAGIYKFIYSVTAGGQTCTDTVAVTVEACAGCTKPNAGPDAAAVCQPTATAKLTAVTAGGTWAPIGSPANPAAATIDASGNISGMTAPGTYAFIYSIVGGGQTCTDTARVTVNPQPTIASANGYPACRPNDTAYTIKFTATGGTVTTVPSLPVTGDSIANIPLTTASVKLIITSAAGCKDSITVTAPVCNQPVGSIGDLIWKDTDDNGIQNLPGEKGVAGVKVNLYAAAAGTKTGAVLQTKTTGTDGLYLFTGLLAGDYIVEIDKTTLPDTCQITTKQNIPGDDTKDSDFNPSTGLSHVITLNPFFTPTTPAEQLATNNLTVDAGLIKPATVCQKPNAGADQNLSCGAVAPTTADLADAAVGQKWKVLSVQPGTTVTVTTPAGAVSGMTLPGTYQFVLQTQTDSLTCRDTVSITVPDCSCPAVNVLTPNATVCKDSLFPTLTVAITGANTAGVSAAWYANATGGSSLFAGLSFKPTGTASVTDTFYVQLTGVSANCSQNPRTPIVVTVQNCNVEVDLALKKYINKKIAQIGDELTYTLKVYNQSNTNATGVEVTDSIATTVQFQTGSFTAARGSASITGNVIKWTIGNIAANGDTVTLTYRVKATQEGVHFNTAEISKTNEKDKDSTPGNGKEDEDDIDRQCFTVPVKLCTGEKAQVSVPVYLTNVQWFKNGGTTAVASGNTVLLTEVGTYTFTATNQTCPANGCCPVIIESGTNCCPEDYCVPFTVKKRRK